MSELSHFFQKCTWNLNCADFWITVSPYTSIYLHLHQGSGADEVRGASQCHAFYNFSTCACRSESYERDRFKVVSSLMHKQPCWTSRMSRRSLWILRRCPHPNNFQKPSGIWSAADNHYTRDAAAAIPIMPRHPVADMAEILYWHPQCYGCTCPPWRADEVKEELALLSCEG